MTGFTRLAMQYPAVHDPSELVKEHVYARPDYAYGKDQTWRKPRYDTVLLRYDENEGVNTMSNRRVARVHLLFKTELGRDELSLAYIQLFQTVTFDPYCGMYKVKKLERYEVIEVDTIERGVHLIPSYSGLDTAMATGNSPPALDTYTQFFINNHIDLHMYNTVY